MKQFLVIVLVFVAALVVVFSLDAVAPQTPAPIVHGPDYNKPAPAEHTAAQLATLPETQYERIPVNLPFNADVSKYCDPETCTGRPWNVEGIINQFEDNEVAAEEGFGGRNTLVDGKINSIETNFAQGARITFDGPFFASTSVVCMFDQDQLSQLKNLHKGSTIRVDFFDPRRYLKKTIVMHCFYYGE
jgi:hypothetical protein